MDIPERRPLRRLINKVTGRKATSAETEAAILSMVDAAEESGVLEETGAEIISNAFEFNDLTVSEVMTHRVNVVGIKEGTPLDDIVYTALEEGFSRMPVYRENLDDIIGIIIAKDLLSWVGKSDLSEFKLEGVLREAVFIPESGSCVGLFKMLKAKKSGMAVVVDEYGGTAGIVTIEDLVEEIMGSIQDEYDSDEDDSELQIKKIAARKTKHGEIEGEKYQIDGEADPEEVLELFGYELPDDHEYETIAGFVTDLLGYIPNEDEAPSVDYKDIRLIAAKTEDNCISRVIAFKIEKECKACEKATK